MQESEPRERTTNRVTLTEVDCAIARLMSRSAHESLTTSHASSNAVSLCDNSRQSSFICAAVLRGAVLSSS